MSAFGGESPLSDLPEEDSPAPSMGPESPPKVPPPPPLKLKVTTKKPVESASSSRRSSRIGSRSQSPEKPSPVVSSIKLKFTRPPSPEKLAEIAEEDGNEIVEEKEKGKRGKKRKSEGRAEEEVREAIANGKGKGKKKVKVSHDTALVQGEGEDLEPKKKNVAIKKKGTVPSGKSSTDLISDLFGDDDDDDENDEEAVAVGDKKVVEEKEIAKPVIKIKGKPGPKPKPRPKPISEENTEGEGDIKMDEDDVSGERIMESNKASGSKSRRGQEGVKTDIESAPSAEIKSKSKRMTRDAKENEETPMPKDVAETETPAARSTKPKGRPKKPVEGEFTSTSTTTSASTTKEIKEKPIPSAPEVDTNINVTKDATGPISATTVKPKKSFAQVVAGSPPPPEKREKKPLPSITKLAKSAAAATAVSTPDKRILSTGSGSGTGTNTPTTAKKLVPVQKKKEVSLLESTMASLLGGGPKPTPKKEEKDTPKPTPKVMKEVRKGGWTDTWTLTPQQQREVMESRDEREEERRKRMLYRKNPVNLQEAKDSYRLDSTKSRVIPALPYPFGGLGVKTEKAPSMMLQALIERNSQVQKQGQSV